MVLTVQLIMKLTGECLTIPPEEDEVEIETTEETPETEEDYEDETYQ